MEDDRISPMTQMRGVGSRPTTLTNKYVNATSLGGTVEKLETGMTGIYSGCRPEPCYRNEPALKTKLNETLGQVVVSTCARCVTFNDRFVMHLPHLAFRVCPLRLFASMCQLFLKVGLMLCCRFPHVSKNLTAVSLFVELYEYAYQSCDVERPENDASQPS